MIQRVAGWWGWEVVKTGFITLHVIIGDKCKQFYIILFQRVALAKKNILVLLLLFMPGI